MKINKLFSRRKKYIKSGSQVDFDQELPDELATIKQLISIISLSRRMKKSIPRQMETLTKREATAILTPLIDEAKSKGLRKMQDHDEDYLYDDDEYYLDGWGDEFEH